MDLKYATGVVNPKTTAIFFDKLWVPHYGVFINEEDKDYFSKIPNEIVLKFKISEYKDKLDSIFRYGMIRNSRFYEFDFIYGEYMYSIWRNRSLLQIANTLHNEFQIDITPIFFDKTDFENSLNYNNENETVSEKAIEFIIKNIPIILEEELDWKQVMEFRKDKKCVSSAKRLMRWSDLECNGLTCNEVKEKLEHEFDEYLFAIKKHGIQITTGAISTMLSSCTPIIDMINGNNKTLLVGAASISTLLLTYTVDKVISNMELHRSPMACIYNLKKI
ncbi:MAG: hypothetical protein J1E83_13665 [Lachnospiraceae bacterium]|nr:hypothetical protein [Lachnospiraceae bacterium]